MTKSEIQYFRPVLNQVKKAQVDPVYFIFGDETYLIDTLISEIVHQFVGDIQKEINYYIRYASDTSPEEIFSLTAGSGLFSDKKVIIYKDVQQLRPPKIALLSKHLSNPNPDICIILIARTDSISQKKYQPLLKKAKVVRILPLRDAELQQYIRDEFGNYGKKVSDEAIRTIIYLVGEQVYELKTEIAQVANYFLDEPEIKPQHIEQIAGAYAVHDVFELTRAIAGQNQTKSLYILHQLLEKGESPMYILSLLLRHLTILWKIRGYYASGVKNEREIQTKMNLYSKHYTEYKKDLVKWRSEHLQKAMELLFEADRTLKSSQMNPEIVLDRLILKLTNSVGLNKLEL